MSHECSQNKIDLQFQDCCWMSIFWENPLNVSNPPYMHTENIEFWNPHSLSWPSNKIVKFPSWHKHVILVRKVGNEKWHEHNIFLRKIALKILSLKIFYNSTFHNAIGLCLQNTCLIWPKWWRHTLPFIWGDLLLVYWRLCFSKKKLLL